MGKMPDQRFPDFTGYWHKTAGHSNDPLTTVGFVWRYECIACPVRCELWRTESGAFFVHTYRRRLRRWRLKEDVLVAPSGTVVNQRALTLVLEWLKAYMDATATVYGSWHFAFKRRLMA